MAGSSTRRAAGRIEILRALSPESRGRPARVPLLPRALLLRRNGARRLGIARPRGPGARTEIALIRAMNLGGSRRTEAHRPPLRRPPVDPRTHQRRPVAHDE